jgi:hypothetical protein
MKKIKEEKQLWLYGNVFPRKNIARLLPCHQKYPNRLE